MLRYITSQIDWCYLVCHAKTNYNFYVLYQYAEDFRIILIQNKINEGGGEQKIRGTSYYHHGVSEALNQDYCKPTLNYVVIVTTNSLTLLRATTNYLKT